jgi:hypothetical protein
MWPNVERGVGYATKLRLAPVGAHGSEGNHHHAFVI